MRRFVDISVPRNIAHNINESDSAIVYNVDDLKEVVAANKEERARAAAEAEVLLQVHVLFVRARVAGMCAGLGARVCDRPCAAGLSDICHAVLCVAGRAAGL